MKTGLILYFVGSDIENCIDDAALQEQIPEWADRVEVISKTVGHFDIHDAWWALIARGMHRIICRIVEVTDSGSIRMVNRELRLCG